MNRRLPTTLLGLALLFCSAPVLAHESQPVGLINIQSSASQEVETDTLVAQMAIEAEHSDPEQLAETINQTMRWADSLIKQSSEVTLAGSNYNSYPVYDKRIFKKWRGSQQITLKSQNSSILGRLVGELQQKLLMKSLSYQVSPERIRATQDQLIHESIEGFKHRADLIQKQLGASDYIIYRLDINTNSHARPMLNRHSMMAEDRSTSKSSTPATLSPSRQTIQVNANGSIQISQ